MIYNVYGTESADLQDAKIVIEKALGIIFEARESTYHCGDYFLFGEQGHENFLLKRNRDPFDMQSALTDFPRYKTILYVNCTLREAEIHRKIIEDAIDFDLLLRKDEVGSSYLAENAEHDLRAEPR